MSNMFQLKVRGRKGGRKFRRKTHNLCMYYVSVIGPRHNGSSATFNTSSDIKIAIQVNSSSTSSSSVTQQHCLHSVEDNKEEDDKKNNNINVQVKFDTTPNGNINVREVSISPAKEENNDDDPEEPFDTSANELSIGNMVSPIKPTGNLSTLVINDDNNNVLSSNTTGQAVPTTDDGNDESSEFNKTFTINSPPPPPRKTSLIRSLA